MKKIKWLSLALVAVLFGCLSVPSPKRGAFKIVSYNIHHGEAMDGTLELRNAGWRINGERPRFAGLQEVDQKTARVKGQDTCAILEKTTGMHATFAKAIDFAGGEYGNALLSQEVPLAVRRVPLPGEEPRVLLLCEFDDCWVGVTHLAVDSEENRLGSIAAIEKAVAACGSKPVFLMGDWNSMPESVVLKGLKRFLTVVSDESAATFHGGKTDPTELANRDNCIDYIAVDAAHRGDYVVRGRRTIPDYRNSDHMPIVVEVEPTPVEKPEGAFTIASFNVRCPGDKGELAWFRRQPRVAEVVKAHDFDVFGVQEATLGEMEILEGELPGFATVGCGRNKDRGGEGMYIFYRTSRFDCLGHGTFWLSKTPDEPGSKYPSAACPRTCTWALLKDRVTGRRFRYFNTHLDHVSPEARIDGLRVLFERGVRPAKARGETVFLTGDLNETLDKVDSPESLAAIDGPTLAAAAKENPIAFAATELVDTIRVTETPHAGPFRTFHGYRGEPRCRIDYVFATDNVRVLRHATHDDRPDGQFASDHYPVSATVEIGDMPPAELVNPTLPPVTVLKTPDGEPIELVKDGKLQFVLVGDFAKENRIRGPKRDGQELSITRWGRDSRRQAVRRLQEAFRATTGETPVFTECDDPAIAKYRYVVVCGKCRYTDELGFDPDKLPREGFRVQTFAKGVVIAGMDGFEIPGEMDNFNWRCGRMTCNGTELGAIDFAERFLGIRKYGFEDKKADLTWEHAPKVASLTLPPCAYEDRPRQRIRTLRTPWRNGCSSSFFGGEAPSPFALIKAHPDRLEDMFYRDEGGRLWCDAKSYGMNFLDFSNPKLADILVEDFKEYYRNDSVGSYWGTTWAPSGDYLWIGQCDKGMVMKNERTAKIPPAKGGFAMSEVYGHFYRYFAEKCEAAFPGKTVVLMAYSNYLTAPTSIEKLPDNVQIMCCLGSPAFARSKLFQKIWKETYGGWNRLTKKKCVPYSYDVGYDEDEVIQQAIRGYFEGDFYKIFKDDIDPELTYNCMYRGGAPYHYSTYLASRCMWNPDFNVDAALEEYFRLMYGPAAEKAREFYYGVLDRWINHYLPYETEDGGYGSRLGSIPCPMKNVFNFKTFEQCAARKLLAILDEGEKLVAKDSLEGRRFAWFAAPFRNQLEDMIAFQNMKHISLDVPKAQAQVAVDGALDESAWAAAKLPAFHRAYAGGDRPCLSPETALLWDEKGLYVGIRSPQPYATADALWKGDSLEVMLAPSVGGKVSNLYQFVFDPSNNYEDFWKQIDPPRGKEINWRAPNVAHAAKAGTDAWTGELFVPWKDLAQGEVPKAGDTWKVNLIYNRKKPYEYISLSPTQNNNHRIDLYATITFKP